MADTARLAALKLLARRELSEAQVRLRLARRGFGDDDIDAAIATLKADRSLDDERVAGAIARTQALRRRGRLRVRREIEAAGIAASIAQRAADDVFAGIDPDVVIAAALERKLRGRTALADDREFQRLYRFLVAQGFDHDRVLAALRALPRDE